MSETLALLPAKYAFGIKEIDDHHGILLDFIARLEAALGSEQGWMIVHEILVKLGQWAEIHFAIEEALMRIMAYPRCAEHRGQHETFIAMLKTYKSQSLRESVAAEAVRTLRDWLIRHIDIDDRHYAEHFSSHPAGTAVRGE